MRSRRRAVPNGCRILYPRVTAVVRGSSDLRTMTSLTNLTSEAGNAPADGDRSPLEELARALAAGGEYRVLRKFRPRERYGTAAAEAELRRGVLLDVETTGTGATDRIIEIACLPFAFDRRTGTVVEVDPVVSFLEDPGFAIPEAVVELTRITDAMVAGRAIDEAAIEAVLMAADLVIAHNARFDCPFVERRLPRLPSRFWGCSMLEVPWKRYGNPSNAMEALLITHGGAFAPDDDGEHAHRAGADCAMTLHCLATPFADGTLPLGHLLASARRETWQAWATGSPIATKDALKARGYRWCNGDDDRPRAWWRELLPAELPAEREWLAAEVYAGTRAAPQFRKVTARNRYSAVWERDVVQADQAVLPAPRPGVRRETV